MQQVKFQSGDVILTEGETGDSAYLILSGSVEVILGEGEHERVVATLNKGDVFGEMSLIEPGPRSATIVASSDTECAVTSYSDFMASMRDDPAQAFEFMKVLVLRLRHMNEMVMGLDPEKRGLMEVFRDWVLPLDTDDASLTPEERERRIAMVMCSVPYI